KGKWEGEDKDDDGPLYSDWEASSEDDEVKAKPQRQQRRRPRRRGRFKQQLAEKEAARRTQLAAGGSNADYDKDAVLDPREKARLEREQSPQRHGALRFQHSRVRRRRFDLVVFVFSHMRTGSSADADLDNIPKSSPSSKEDFVALSEAIIAYIVKRHQDKPLYSTFVEHHVRALAMPLRDVDVRKAASGLTTLANERQREKTNGKKKPKAAAKPVLAASKVGNKLDTTVYDETLDDFGSNADDFM
ncbi:translation initiation factor eIF3 subunit, partial [Lactarius pseudohatsudake]